MFVHCLFLIIWLGGETTSKRGRKNHDEKSIGFANAFYIFSIHDCFMKLRPEIVEIVGDSYDPKRLPLKGVAFNTHLTMQEEFFSIF